MLFDFGCKQCEVRFEVDFRVGEAPAHIECPDCGSEAKRQFTSCNFILKGGGWPSKKGSFNKEMTDRNERAGKRMRVEHGEHGPLKLAALDYGNGDVREVKK